MSDTVVRINGVDQSSARRGNASIRKVLNPNPNMGTFTFDDVVPVEGQSIEVALVTESPERLLFSGEVQAVVETYDLQNTNVRYDVRAVDRTFKANRLRPFGTWTNESATTVALAVAAFAPDCTTTGIEAGLPDISIIFDGSQPFMTCWQALATAVGGGCSATINEANDLGLFITDPYEAPDPIDAAHPPLNDTPIAFSTDLSQIRTRMYGKGYTGTVANDVLAQDTIVPIAAADAVMFSAGGGQAILGRTAGAAQSDIIDYTGVALGGGGSLVGPGAAPSTAPALTLASGTGMGTGVYQYAYTDVTGSGESLPSPLGTITTGVTAAPSTALTPGTPTAGTGGGNGVTTGSHDYATTLVTSAGETTVGPISASVSTGPISAPASAMTGFVASFTGGVPAGNHDWAVTFVNAGGETTPSPLLTLNVSAPNGLVTLQNIPLGGASVTQRKIYRTAAGGSQLKLVFTINDNTTTGTTDGLADASLGANVPTSNTAVMAVVPLTGIPLGDANCTGRNVYRRFNGTGTFKFCFALGDNSTTTFSDTAANSDLGADAPSSNTAAALRVSVTGIAIGASPTTSRKVYRTAVGGSQLKLLATIANNTTTIYADSTADGSLGANAPTSDTSGITQPSGQVNAGSITLLLASAGPFSTSGGWALGPSGLAIRYLGISGNTLTGIPASGTGAILTTLVYGAQIIPAPALTGVTNSGSPSVGVPAACAKGSTVAIWVQRDDLAAQTALAALEGGDGIREDTFVDGRFGAALLTSTLDALLVKYSHAIVSASYGTLDAKSRVGAVVSLGLSTSFLGTFNPAFYSAVYGTVTGSLPFGLTGDFTIQDIVITFIGAALTPRFQVTASSFSFTVMDLQRLALLG